MLDNPTAATICVGMLSATAVITSAIWKLVPQKHVVHTEEGERCATKEQLEAVAEVIKRQLRANRKYYRSFLKPMMTKIQILIDRSHN